MKVQPIRSKETLNKFRENLPSKIRLLFDISLTTGNRISDTIGLRYEDILSGQIIIKEQKTGKAKRIVFSKKVIESVKKLGKTEGYIFTSSRGSNVGSLYSHTYVERILKQTAKKMGIKDNINTHTARKTFGYMNFSSGVPIEIIQKALNHSSPAITLGYIGITDDQIDSLYSNMNSIID